MDFSPVLGIGWVVDDFHACYLLLNRCATVQLLDMFGNTDVEAIAAGARSVGDGEDAVTRLSDVEYGGQA